MTYVETNYKVIGEEIYKILDDEDKGIVAFGMIPKPIIDIATDSLVDKIIKNAIKTWKIKDPDKEFIRNTKKGIKKEAINDFQHKLTVAIFNAAHEKGGMIA